MSNWLVEQSISDDIPNLEITSIVYAAWDEKLL